LIHQTRLVESDDPVAVGVISRLVGGFQFHEGHTSARLVVDNFDGEVSTCLGGSRSAQGESEDYSQEESHRPEDLSIEHMPLTGGV